MHMTYRAQEGGSSSSPTMYSMPAGLDHQRLLGEHQQLLDHNFTASFATDNQIVGVNYPFHTVDSLPQHHAEISQQPEILQNYYPPTPIEYNAIIGQHHYSLQDSVNDNRGMDLIQHRPDPRETYSPHIQQQISMEPNSNSSVSNTVSASYTAKLIAKKQAKKRLKRPKISQSPDQRATPNDHLTDSRESSFTSQFDNVIDGKGDGNVAITSSSLNSPGYTKTTIQRPVAWSLEEEEKLQDLVDSGTKWSDITKQFPNRSAGAIKKHFYADMKHIVWNPEDDNLLLEAVKQDEEDKWRRVSDRVGKPARNCERRAKNLRLKELNVQSNFEHKTNN